MLLSYLRSCGLDLIVDLIKCHFRIAVCLRGFPHFENGLTGFCRNIIFCTNIFGCKMQLMCRHSVFRVKLQRIPTRNLSGRVFCLECSAKHTITDFAQSPCKLENKNRRSPRMPSLLLWHCPSCPLKSYRLPILDSSEKPLSFHSC